MDELAIDIKNPLTEPLNKIKREMVGREFFADADDFTDYPLSLYKYLSLRPEKFYCKRALSAQLKFLDSSDGSSIIEIINENVTHLEQSLKLLNDINKKPWHDLSLSSDEHDLFRHCDNNVNPSYLNLIEGVFGNLIYINAIASRHNRDKSPDGLDIFNRFEEIKRTSLGFLADEYCNTTRNSIAHGSVKYLHHYIQFRDKKKTITNTHSEYLKRFDSVLDICNGLALAYKIFFFKNITNVRIPKQVLLEELYAQTEAPWWQIEGCLESEVGKNDSQLVIFIKPETRDYGKVRLSAILTAVLAERYAPGYKRYFLSMRSKVALPGFAAFDGELLKEKREKKVSKWEEYSGIIEGDLIFWVPFIKSPKLLNKINTYYLSIKLFLATQRLLKTINSGVELHSRNAKIHRNGWQVVLNADVVIESSYILSTSDVKDIGKKLIKVALKAAKKQLPLYSFLRYLPIGYARVLLFNNDYRCSHLHGFGLRKELIGTVQLHKIKKIKSPDLSDSSIESDGQLIYDWNSSWLE